MGILAQTTIKATVFLSILLAVTTEEYKAVLEVAKDMDTKVILYFTDEDCIWCAKFVETLADKSVEPNLADYLLLELDITENRQLANKFGIRLVPSCVMINGDEKIISKVTGYQDPEKFNEWLIKHK